MIDKIEQRFNERMQEDPQDFELPFSYNQPDYERDMKFEFSAGAKWMQSQMQSQVDTLKADNQQLRELVQGKVVCDLDVWFGPMPESNGKTNWTAMLYRRGDLFDGITLTRSENKELVRYDADCFRYIIGQLADKPCPLDYDVEGAAGSEDEEQSVVPQGWNVDIDASVYGEVVVTDPHGHQEIFHHDEVANRLLRVMLATAAPAEPVSAPEGL